MIRQQTLEQRVAQRTQELTALYSVAAVVSRSLDLEQILPDALEETIKVMGMDAGAVFRLDDESQTLLLAASQGLSKELIKLSRRMPLVLSIVREVISINHPLSRRVADYPSDQVRQLLEKDGWKTVVSIPLLAQDKALGAINVLSRSHAELTEEELVVPSAIGQQIGVAMDNARLYNQSLEYARQMEVARQQAETANAQERLPGECQPRAAHAAGFDPGIHTDRPETAGRTHLPIPATGSCEIRQDLPPDTGETTTLSPNV